MGVYRAAVVTESGQNIIAQALANEQPLIFTSAKTSRYAYPLGTNIPALTGLQDVVQSVMPFDSKVINGNVAQVSVRFDNDEIDQVYRIETIGLYAKIEGGTETLFSVTQAITPDEMPIHSDVSPSAYIYNIQHTVQNASQITLTVNPTGTATVQDIMDIEQPEFDDSGTVSGIDSFPAFLNKTKSKMNIFQWYRDFKAGMQFVLHAGQIVNNCVSSDADKPLAAAQGKALQDQLTKLYSDMSKFDIYHRDITGNLHENITIQTALEDFKNTVVTNKPILVEIQNHLGGRALAVGIQSLSNYNSFLVITYYDRPKEFVYALNHWEVYELVTKSDLKVLKKADVKFSNGFTEISFPGITYNSNVCVTQEYRSSDGVQNLVFTAQVRPNELIIYARNAGDGSSYNGILNIMVIAIE